MTESNPHIPVTDPTMTAPIPTDRERVVGDNANPVGQVVLEATGVNSSLHIEAEPKPAYAVIEASIEAMEEEVTSIWETMNTAYEASSDEVKQKIDQLEEDYGAEVQRAEEQGDERPSLANFLSTADDIPEEFKTGMLAYEASTVKIEAAEEELEKYAPEKAVEVRQKVAELEASLDYDKVVAQAYADEDDTTPFEGVRYSSINLLYDVSRVVSVRKLLESDTPLTYRRLKSVERSLEVSAAEYAEKGLMREQGKAVAETVPSLTDEQITALEAHIKGVYDLRIKYKKFDGTLLKKTQTVLNLTRQMKERDDEVPTDLDEIYTRAKIVFNDGLGAAVNLRLTQKLKELPADEFDADINSEAYTQLVEQARGTDLAEALKKLEISGSLENLPFEFSETELKLFLLTSVPAVVLASVKRIQFRSMTQDEDKEDNTLGLHKWSEELGGSEIIISDAKVRERYQDILELFGDDPNAEQYAQLSARNRMLQTITHEFGHELHEILPVAALKRWEEQRASDPTNITAYVKSRHDSDHMHRYMEDFADTMALFINQPEILTVISPTRFNAMQQIFEEVMPLYPEATKKLQYRRISVDRTTRLSKGMSDELVKSTYLSHETAQ